MSSSDTTHLNLLLLVMAWRCFGIVVYLWERKGGVSVIFVVYVYVYVYVHLFIFGKDLK